MLRQVRVLLLWPMASASASCTDEGLSEISKHKHVHAFCHCHANLGTQCNLPYTAMMGSSWEGFVSGATQAWVSVHAAQARRSNHSDSSSLESF